MIRDYWLNDLLITRYFGEVTGAQLTEASLEKSGDPRLDDIKFIIGDWTNAETKSFTPADIDCLVAVLKPISSICPSAKTAVIVRPDKSGNALASYYKLLCQTLTWQVNIFHTVNEAFEAFSIDIPPPYEELPRNS